MASLGRPDERPESSDGLRTSALPAPVPQRLPMAPRGPVPHSELAQTGGCDTLAVASAVCGLTAFIPIVAQVIGLTVGIASLIRIRRARQRGVHVRGGVWALIGISTSGFALLSWIVVIVFLLSVAGAFVYTVDTLPGK